MSESPFRPATEGEIARDWEDFTGGAPVIGILGKYQPQDVEALLLDDPERGQRGLVSWWTDGDHAEIVSLHAEPTGSGVGSRLMDAAEEALQRRGVRRIVLATTNDNARALNFYIRHGFRLVRLHLDEMDRVREVKPSVPEEGRGGVPLQDMWELEKGLQ